MKNLKLKIAIVQVDKPQCEIAEETGISESILSQIINGRVIPNDSEKEKLAIAINCPVKKLF